jgi:hypothetical protein
LSSRLPHRKAVALIDPEWLVDLRHHYFLSAVAKIAGNPFRQKLPDVSQGTPGPKAPAYR